MNPRRTPLWLCLSWMLLAIGIPGPPPNADDGAIHSVGGSVSALIPHPMIEMEAEYVHAWIGDEEVRVECVFFFWNRGPATTVEMGFPCTSSGADVDGATPFKEFRSYVDGREVKVRDLAGRAGDEYSQSWKVKKVRFENNQKRCIREVYRAEPGSSVPNDHWFEYVLETGATWAGTIGVAEIVITLEGNLSAQQVHATPTATSTAGNELRWHFLNFEPEGPDSSSVFVSWSADR